MKLLVLAGGFGTRLQHLGLGMPKALAPVGSSPFLELQINNWLNQGITSFVFLLHHQADQIEKYLLSIKNDLLAGCELSIVIENTALDTGGAIANAVRELSLNEDFLVANADTWLEAGIAELGRSPGPTVAVLQVDDASRFGLVNFDDRGFVQSFVEKDQCQTMGWINAGLYRFNTDLFLAQDKAKFSIERDVLPLLAIDTKLIAAKIESNFIDIGVPNDYYRFCRWIESERNYPL